MNRYGCILEMNLETLWKISVTESDIASAGVPSLRGMMSSSGKVPAILADADAKVACEFLADTLDLLAKASERTWSSLAGAEPFSSLSSIEKSTVLLLVVFNSSVPQ